MAFHEEERPLLGPKVVKQEVCGQLWLDSGNRMPLPCIVPQEVFPSHDESGRKLRSDQPVAGHLGEGV